MVSECCTALRLSRAKIEQSPADKNEMSFDSVSEVSKPGVSSSASGSRPRKQKLLKDKEKERQTRREGVGHGCDKTTLVASTLETNDGRAYDRFR